MLGRLGRESEAIPVLEQALELFRRHGDAEMEAETLQNLAACKSRLQRDDAERGFPSRRRAVPRAGRLRRAS